ncbi:hypothetical protein BDN71DRAFT_1501525 [Pleurotus eryngii]|uniref:Uncharacterized protein n=1 Tax=Pleurotus eryngii TaxID=5323 RepID=A0A9P6A7B5_PLEER|nr:hypothetical protein BDN71DRAFT_1501525 [Pleurotus eryngii]
MSFSRRLLNARSPTRLIATARPRICVARHALSRQDHRAARPIFSFFRRSKKNDGATGKPSEPVPVLTEDNLFHPFSKSPFPAVRARGEAIQSLAPCPVCSSHDRAHTHAHIEAQPKTTSFECPDCGWPTHCSEEHWAEDHEHHDKYCARLREANEDEHDLRSGRKFREFELPGSQGFEEAMSFANWDLFWYTRNFPSMDTERSRRHASKLLTYPITIGGALHQFSGLTLSNQRLTPEGSRSLAALRTTLHVPTGTPETEENAVGKPQVRVFILGARAESSLPPHVWEQLTMLFPSTHFHLFFIGPQVSLPKPPSSQAKPSTATPDQPPATEQATSETPEKETTAIEEKPTSYVPNVYEPPTPAPIERLKRTRESIARYGVPSYTVPYTPQLTITGMQANYAEVHAQFADTLDPYSDLFFLFSPGFGFPSPTSVNPDTNEPLLQIASPTEWGPVLPMLLASKCAIFVTGFSPADVERDVKSLSKAPDVAGEFDWVITPGKNEFGSEKWEIADFDPRVMVKTNWGIWAIRGKSRDIRERTGFSLFR